jgi:acyl dehydratase
MGVACRAILKRLSPGRPERLRSMFVRFAQPAYPGETLRIELFDEGDKVRFRALAVERNVIVLDRGECRLSDH